MILKSEMDQALKNALDHVGHQASLFPSCTAQVVGLMNIYRSFRASKKQFCALAQFIFKNSTLTRGADISGA